MAGSELNINEIEEKYEYLYLDYKRSFERHKMKTVQGLLEVLTIGLGTLLTGILPTAMIMASQLFKIGSMQLDLLREEGTIPGKEIAYIYHANKRFV